MCIDVFSHFIASPLPSCDVVKCDHVFVQNGDGFVDSEAKLKKITTAISACLK